MYYSELKQVDSGIIPTMFPIPKLSTYGDSNPSKEPAGKKIKNKIRISNDASLSARQKGQRESSNTSTRKSIEEEDKHFSFLVLAHLFKLSQKKKNHNLKMYKAFFSPHLF